MTPPITELLKKLQTSALTSRFLIEACLTAIDDPAGEGARTFTRVYEASARAEAETNKTGPLAGIPISIKDLFDVAGETTTSGSTVLQNAPPASTDATVVSRLKAAGAILIGRTNMTEFAYSGLGLNPHYGTPRNPWDRKTGRIPGGSSSGAAISVSDGMAAAAIGSDTGGSVRIPAALCGLVGFKPTARRISMDGVLPLAPTLDSIGPIAPTVACCALLDAVLAGDTPQPLAIRDISSLRLGVLQGYVLDDLDTPVSQAFERAIAMLRAAGAKVSDLPFTALHLIPSSNQFASAEAFAWHRDLLERVGNQYDPHVFTRIRHGATMLAADYIDLTRVRRELILAAHHAFDGYDAILLPTTPRIAPPIADLEISDHAYFDANGAMLRNPSIFNYLDGCALSVPCHQAGTAPVGLMAAGLGGWDISILEAGAAIERVLLPLR